MEPAQSIIAKCGGAASVSEWTSVHVTRVRRWTYPKSRGGTGGLIPAAHQAPLLAAARARGIPLEPADFFANETPEAA